MLLHTFLFKNVRYANVVFRLCINSKPPDDMETKISSEQKQDTTILIDAKEPHCNPHLNEANNFSVETYKDSKEFKEVILKKVLIEKEVDANARSRLAKECKHFISSTFKNLKDSTGCRLSFNQSGWQTYDFDKFDIHSREKETTLNDCLGKTPLPSSPSCTIKEKTAPCKDEDKPAMTRDNQGFPPTSPKDPPPTSPEDPPPTNRLVRQEPGKVIATFIPIEYWQFFFPKTGVSGFYTFLFTFGTYLVSKEIYVLEHNYYHGLGALGLWIGFIKYIGPILTKFLDEEIDKYDQQWKDVREANRKALEDAVVQERFHQFQSEGQLILIEAKRENVALQLEEEFRSRQMKVYNEVKRILDYHMEIEAVKTRFQQKNLVEYVTNEVTKSITPDLQNKLINYSIDSILLQLENNNKTNN